MLGHPKLIEFNKKYKVLINYWRNGFCTLNEMFEAIELLEKMQNNKENV